MRTDISAATTTLQESGAYDAHWLIQIANGSDTLIDVSGRVAGVSGALPSGDAPIGTLHLEFLRDVNDDPSTSLAPLIASDLNVLDDGTTFSALLQVGRRVVASVALTARGGSRPVDADFDEVFRGRISRVGWGGWYGGAGVDCLDQAGALQRTKSEVEYTYASGTAVETAMQAVLTNSGFSSITLSVPTATSTVLQADYKPGLQKSVWEQLQALASSIGWVCWYRYDAAGVAQLTLFEPDRANTTSAFTFSHIYEVNRFDVDEEAIGNVLYDQYTDSDGARQLTDAVEDADSIEKYGGIRRSFFISEEEGSPVTTDAQATALLTAILPDLADPDADASYKAPLFLFGECGVDVYTFPADDRHYDEDQKLAPFAIRFDHQFGQLPTSTLDVRGKPSGGSGKWKARRADPGSIPSEPVSVYALDIKEIGRAPDDSTATFDGPWGSKIVEVRTFEALVAQPYATDSWPSITGDPTQGPFTSRVPIVFDVPPQGYARLVYAVGILADGTPGAIERLTILPTGTEPDLVTGLTVLVNDSDGSATIRVDVADRANSIRYAYAVDSDPDWPADATIEAGTVLALTGSATITLAAGTVDYLETIRFRCCAYTGADGIGYDGAGDHGPIVGGEDIRLPSDVTLEQTTASEADGVGTFGATLHDASGICTAIEKFTRSGAGDWVGPILITGTPTNGTEYTATVSLQEDHQSQIKIRATYTKNGSVGYVECPSPGFDAGQIPDIKIIPDVDEAARTASASVSGDFDTKSVKIVASTAGEPSEATVRAATPINGRNLTAAEVGPLVTGLSPGDVVNIAGYGYSEEDGGGNESSKVARARITVGVLPALLEVTTESESSTTGTFGVTVRDPSGVATGLYYRTKSGSGAWSARTLVTGTPAHGTEYQQTVTLEEDHLSFIRFELDYTILGVAKSFPIASAGFDKGKIPNVTFKLRYNDDGEVFADYQGDYDTNSAKASAASGSTAPTDAAVRATTAVDGQSGTIGPLLTLAVGETATGKLIGYSEAGGAGTESSDAKTDTITRLASYTPKVQTSVTRSGTTATVALTVTDTLKKVTAVEFNKREGGSYGGWVSTWDASTGTAGTDASLTRSEGVSLARDSELLWRVTYTDENGDSKTLGDAVTFPLYVVPKVKAEITRSGTTATVTVSAEDPRLVVTDIQWSSQAQGGTATSFSSTWSSSTGTPGTDATLTRSKTFTVGDGADLAVRYQVTFTDESGASKVIADTLTLSNLASVTRTIRMPAAELIPSSYTTTWQMLFGVLSPGTVAASGFFGAAVLPVGVTVTAFRARMKRNATGDTAKCLLRRLNDDGSNDLLATLTHSTTGWQTVSASLTELVANSVYVVDVSLQSTSGETDSAIVWWEFDYTRPDYAKAY